MTADKIEIKKTDTIHPELISNDDDIHDNQQALMDTPQDIDDLPPPNDELYMKHEECLLTPPRSPSPSLLPPPPPPTNDSSINDNNMINDRTETVNNINSYHNNIIDKEDRLADNSVDKMQCSLNYADAVKKDQVIKQKQHK